MKLAIIMPAYNEAKVLASVIRSLPKKLEGIDDIVSIVVDDGSSDKTYSIAKKSADYAVRNLVNMGVGTATKLGIETAKKIKADIIVTMDSDGQHASSDIEKLIQPVLRNNADIAIGSRMDHRKEMPGIKLIGNWMMNLLTFLVFHKWVSDSQSGMKAMSKKALNKMQIESIGYEICSEIIGEAKYHKLRIVEVPIRTIYTDYSKVKGQNIFNAVNIFTRMLSLRAGKRR
jgi:glycosyltransferase involved in cell wall biosynthesis